MARPEHSKEDFRNREQEGADFRKFKLYMARFEFSKFPNSNFSAVSAKHCCFIRAQLSGSDFTGANLERSNFSGADLRGASFRSAKLDGANFDGALIEGATFVGASMKMCRGLKLTDVQANELEQAKAASRDDLARRKASPEYQLKKVERLLQKPWVASAADQRSVGGSVVVTLKEGYEFVGVPGGATQSFASAEAADEGTVKGAVKPGA